VVEKAGREIFRCSLSGRATGRWLEIPAWMFDRAARAAWRVGAAPYVGIAVLTALATLLQDVTSVSGEVSGLIVYLASDESRYCTGSEFIIDGGYTAQ
jgi:NAD(P)-dependent dehydrogenase (short-subunit alcohol dehydrogenase family)